MGRREHLGSNTPAVTLSLSLLRMQDIFWKGKYSEWDVLMSTRGWDCWERKREVLLAECGEVQLGGRGLGSVHIAEIVLSL